MAKKEPQNKSPDAMQEIRMNITAWHNSKLKIWAKDNGMTVRAAIRYIINQFFKSNQ